MKSITQHFLRSYVFCLVACFVANAQVEELPRKDIEQLVRRRPMMNPDQKVSDDWRLEVRSRKGINPDLIAMAKQEKDWELIGQVFAALRERTDLTADELDELKMPLDKIGATRWGQSSRINNHLRRGVPD
jgi:hypothetical protein